MTKNTPLRGFRSFNTSEPLPDNEETQPRLSPKQELIFYDPETPSYFCPHCGQQIISLNIYCSQCGQVVPDTLHIENARTIQFSPAVEQMQDFQQEYASPNLEEKPLPWLWIGAALFGAAVLGGIWLVSGLVSPPRASQPTMQEGVLLSLADVVETQAAMQAIEQTLTVEVTDPAIFPELPTATAVPTRTSKPINVLSAAPGVGTVRVRPMDEMVQVYVPAGEFVMGSNDGEEDEGPARKVYVDSFWIDQTEVSTTQYHRCVAEKGCLLPDQLSSATRASYYLTDGYENYPVVFVNWRSANAYCAWAGGRLPSEAEWEKAARGTDGRKYPWGNTSPDSSRMNFNNQVGDTTPVGSYSAGASPYGALDMSGNVWEWVGDMFNAQYMGHRGGSWDFGALAARSANRGGDKPDSAYYNLGFRCANSE
jgi:formylglycine-generating enzyme required for sulfatase activity